MVDFQIWFKKNISWILLNLPALIMFIALCINPRLWEPLTPYTGYISLGLLVIVLALNPLQNMIPTSIFIKKINRFRRQIGVAVLSYALVHVLCFYIKRDGLMDFLHYFLHPAIIPGLLALAIFIPLALTSTNSSVKKLGFVKWKKLHKFVYLAEWLLVLHLFFVGSFMYAGLIFTPLMVLQYLRRRKRKHQLRNGLAQGI